MPWLRGLDGRLRAAVNWRDPAVKRVFVLMLPVTIGLGLINFNAFVDTLFASNLLDPALAPAAIDAAFRLYMLPQGLFSVAVATVLFPSLSRFAAAGDMGRFRRTVGEGLRQIAFLLVPASVFCAVLAQPIVQLVYQRGALPPSRRTSSRPVSRRSRWADVQRRDAPAQPIVLRPPVAVAADDGRSRTSG